MVAQTQEPDIFTQLLDWLGVYHFRSYAFLGVVSLCLFLPGFFTLQPMDRDEPRFAQATKQMLETGDFVSIRFQDEARNKKPVGINWLQAAAVSMGETLGVPEARSQIWLYRLPSLIAAITTVLLSYWTALAFTDRRRALFAGVLIGSCVLLGVEAHLAKTDATLTASVVAAFGALARLYLRRVLTLRHVLVFWLAIAVGILIKGPITPLIVLLTIAVLSYYERSFHWLRGIRPGLGLLLCLIVVAPWFILIGIKTQGAFFSQAIGQDMLGKVAQGQESHGAPPLTYFALFWATGWPLAPLTLLAAPLIWAERKSPKIFFLLAWVIPSWVMFELVPTKLPHYVLPLYPALAILTASFIGNAQMFRAGILRQLSGFLTFLVPVVISGAGALLWLNAIHPLRADLASFSEPDPFAALYLALVVVLALVALTLLVFSRRHARVGETESALGFGTLAAFVLFLIAYSCVLTTSAFSPFALSPRLVAAQEDAETASGCVHLAPVSTVYREPSLVFLTETRLKFADAVEAANFLNESGCRIAFVEARDEPAFKAALAPQWLHDPVERVAGINLGSGKRLDIGVYVRQ